MKKFILHICIFFILATGFSQPRVVSVGFVHYEGGGKDDSILYKYSVVINSFVNEYYRKNVGRIYVSIGAQYLAAYDNLLGNSLTNKLYNRTRHFDKPGLRIQVIDSSIFKLSDFLKLLDYSLQNRKELKSIYRINLKQDYYDQPTIMSIESTSIKAIIENPNDRVNEFLDKVMVNE
jgi:hypothetical protein